MSNRWIASVAMLCPEAHREAAAATAASLSGNPADNTASFFSRAVRLIGGDVVTHYLAHSRVREVVLMQLPALPVMFPGATYILTSHDDHPELNYLRVEDWLASMGLELVEEDL